MCGEGGFLVGSRFLGIEDVKEFCVFSREPFEGNMIRHGMFCALGGTNAFGERKVIIVSYERIHPSLSKGFPSWLRHGRRWIFLMGMLLNDGDQRRGRVHVILKVRGGEWRCLLLEGYCSLEFSSTKTKGSGGVAPMIRVSKGVVTGRCSSNKESSSQISKGVGDVERLWMIRFSW